MLDRHNNDLETPRLVDALTGLAVKELVLCSTFGAILTVEGQVWRWAPDRPGTGTYAWSLTDCGPSVPQPITSPVRMASIVPGYALSELGVLFSFSETGFLQTDAHSVLGEPIVQVSSCPHMIAVGEKISPLLLTASGTAVYTDLGPVSGGLEHVVSLSFVHAPGPVQEVLRSDHSTHVRPTTVSTSTALDFILCDGCVYSIDIDVVLKLIPMKETGFVMHICDGRTVCFALCANDARYRIETEVKAAKRINKAKATYAEKARADTRAKPEVCHDENPDAMHTGICDGALRWSLRNPASSVVSSRAPRPPEHAVAAPDVLKVFGLPSLPSSPVVELSESSCGDCLARTADGMVYSYEFEPIISCEFTANSTPALVAVNVLHCTGMMEGWMEYIW